MEQESSSVLFIAQNNPGCFSAFCVSAQPQHGPRTGPAQADYFAIGGFSRGDEGEGIGEWYSPVNRKLKRIAFFEQSALSAVLRPEQRTGLRRIFVANGRPIWIDEAQRIGFPSCQIGCLANFP